jgi:hypothetical protein
VDFRDHVALDSSNMTWKNKGSASTRHLVAWSVYRGTVSTVLESLKGLSILRNGDCVRHVLA